MKKQIDTIANHFSAIMRELKLDLTDPSLRDTPQRYAKMMVNEICSANFTKPPKLTTFPVGEAADQMVIVRNISIHSLCEHHFLPFIGVCHIAYFPDKKLLGLSKFNRSAQYFGNKPQVQERLTNEIAHYLKSGLQTEDVAVVITAKHLCYDSETEILTDRGFTFFKDLLKTDTVAQFDLATSKVTFTKPKKYYKVKYAGKMININKKAFSMSVTPDHRVIYQTEWNHYNTGKYDICEASELLTKLTKGVSLFIPRSGTYETKNNKYITIAGKRWNYSDYVKYMGAFLSEGSTTYSKTNRGYKIVIVQDKKSKGYNEYSALCKRIPFKCEEYIQPNGTKIHFVSYSKELYDYLAPFGKSGDKFVPDNIKKASVDLRIEFLKFYHLGDGWNRVNKPLSGGFTTKSTKMANDLQELLALTNTSSYLSKRNTENSAYDVYQHYTKGKKVSSKTHTSIRLEDLSVDSYSGYVYCVDVPKSALVVRRHGSVFISGNCCAIRGVHDANSDTLTSHLGGRFREQEVRAELFNLINLSKV